ncbi:MAG: hypothetical protein IJT34_08790 [Butyrivibrio sp.]|nr:hypothetical protein [Butyrivibrio sp.]
MDQIFDLAIAFFGIYMIYTAVQLKVNKVIRPGVVVPGSVNVRAIKDRDGLIAYTFPRMLIEGVVLIAIGFAGIVFGLMGQSVIHMVAYIATLIFLLVFNRIMEKGKKQYY